MRSAENFNIQNLNSCFIPLPIVQGKKVKKKCCKKFKDGKRCKKCPGRKD